MLRQLRERDHTLFQQRLQLLPAQSLLLADLCPTATELRNLQEWAAKRSGASGSAWIAWRPRVASCRAGTRCPHRNCTGMPGAEAQARERKMILSSQASAGIAVSQTIRPAREMPAAWTAFRSPHTR